VRYANARLALEAVRQNVGFLVCGLSLLLFELEAGSVVLPFPLSERLASPQPYRLRTRADSVQRPQIQRFIGWLRAEADETMRKISKLTG
jgi:LysR family glycine cleavage system transcriptional activator